MSVSPHYAEERSGSSKGWRKKMMWEDSPVMGRREMGRRAKLRVSHALI
jgi:hypothetical protein